MQDLWIPIVDLTIEDYRQFSEDIRNSNLPASTKNGLYDLMEMARSHTVAAVKNGWITCAEGYI